MRIKSSLLAVALMAAIPTAANATIATVFDDFDGGLTNFNANVALDPTAVAIHDVVSFGFSGTSYAGAGYTVTKPTGVSFSTSSYTLSGSAPSRDMSGGAFNINPAANAGAPGAPGHGAGNANDSRDSGIQFSFTSGVNAIGFEVGDWSTCCQVSNIYISFGGGAPILVGSSTVGGDQFLTNGGAGVFVAAFDDSSTFTTVNFWGDGYGEFLVAGGTIHFSKIRGGTLPPTGVPEPLTLSLFSAGLVGAAAMRRRLKKAKA